MLIVFGSSKSGMWCTCVCNKSSFETISNDISSLADWTPFLTHFWCLMSGYLSMCEFQKYLSFDVWLSLIAINKTTNSQTKMTTDCFEECEHSVRWVLAKFSLTLTLKRFNLLSINWFSFNTSLRSKNESREILVTPLNLFVHLNLTTVQQAIFDRRFIDLVDYLTVHFQPREGVVP